jgi:hypothetical protein
MGYRMFWIVGSGEESQTRRVVGFKVLALFGSGRRAGTDSCDCNCNCNFKLPHRNAPVTTNLNRHKRGQPMAAAHASSREL